MPCYHPMLAYRSRSLNENGKRPITFKASEGYTDLTVKLPCGQCIGCRLERSRQWAVRCVHEAQLHDSNCFITLTYNDENLPKDGSLHKDHFQKFMKRLRKQIEPIRVRYFQCGEYGEQLNRPHYHCCLFGYDFPDKQLWSIRKGTKLYRSESLEKLWPFGFSTIGDVTFESAAYVARYIMKKQTGANAEEYYRGRLPEYIAMSRRPGLAREWAELFLGDVYPADEIVIRGNMKCRPPKYYDAIFDCVDHRKMEKIKQARVVRAKENDEGLERLAVKERVKLKQVKELKRNYETVSV